MTRCHLRLGWNLAILLGGLLFCTGVCAGELDWRMVPEGWRWVVHLNVEQIRQSSAAGTVLKRFWDRFPDRAEIESIALLAEADIQNSLRGVTFLGRSFDPRQGVVLVQVRVNQARLVGFVSSSPEHATEMLHDVTVHRWFDPTEKTMIWGCFLPDDWLVISRDGETVRAIITKRLGTQEVPGADSFFKVREGTYLEIHANTTDELSAPFVSPVLRRSRRLTAAIGEHRQQAFIQATFELEGADTALNVRDAISGLVAIGKLHFADEPHYVALLDCARAFACENKTTFVWVAGADEILTVARKVLPWFREN